MVTEDDQIKRSGSLYILLWVHESAWPGGAEGHWFTRETLDRLRPSSAWLGAGYIRLRSHEPNTRRYIVDGAVLARSLRGAGLGAYLYSAAADAAAARGGAVYSWSGGRNELSERLWRSETLRRHYDITHDAALSADILRPKP